MIRKKTATWLPCSQHRARKGRASAKHNLQQNKSESAVDPARSSQLRKRRRRNGPKSKGPNTTRGKAFSRRNAVAHGLWTLPANMPDEDRSRVEELHKNLWQDCSPSGALEQTLVGKIAHCVWRLERSFSCEQDSTMLRLSKLGFSPPYKQPEAVRAQLHDVCRGVLEPNPSL